MNGSLAKAFCVSRLTEDFLPVKRPISSYYSFLLAALSPHKQQILQKSLYVLSTLCVV